MLVMGLPRDRLKVFSEDRLGRCLLLFTTECANLIAIMLIERNQHGFNRLRASINYPTLWTSSICALPSVQHSEFSKEAEAAHT